MALQYTGDAILKVGLSVLTPKPIDDRLVVPKKSDLYTIDPRYAYEGMSVSIVESGSISTLVDINKIKSPEGWRSSYESIQIIACSQQEYLEWKANTDKNNLPIDPSKPFIIEDVYYYLYEETLDEETRLGEYATAAEVIALSAEIRSISDGTAIARNKLKLELLKEFSDADSALKTYVEQHFISNDFLNGTEGGLKGLLAEYYTKDEADNTFVKLSDLLGEVDDSEEVTYKFLPTSKYEEDLKALEEYKKSILQDLDKTIKVDGQGSLDSLTIKQLVLGLTVITEKEDGIYAGSEQIAYLSNLPKLVTLTLDAYNELKDADELDPDTYYYIEEIEDYYVLNSLLDSKLAQYATLQYVASKLSGYVTSLNFDDAISNIGNNVEVLLESYYNKEQIDELAKSLVTIDSLKTELEKYVTKELLGGNDDGSLDYIFITKKEYQDSLDAKDELILEYLDKKVDKDSDVTFTNVNTPTIKNLETIVTLQDHTIFVGDYPVALDKDIPKIKVLSQQAYLEKAEQDLIEGDVYYMTYDGDENLAWVTANTLSEYYNKALTDVLITELRNKINNLRTLLEFALLTIARLIKLHEDKELTEVDDDSDIVNGDDTSE